MIMTKKEGGGRPFVRKAPYEYEGQSYEADIKNGDTVKIIDAGHTETGTFGEQTIFAIETRNGEKNAPFNQSTINVLVDEFGNDSEKWAGQTVRVIIKKDTVAGKKVDIAYFVSGDWNLDEYGELCRPKDKGEITPDDIPFN